MTVLEYANKFNELGHFCPNLIEFKRSKANIFEHGLRYKIRSRLSSYLFNNYKDVLERALKVELDTKRSEQEMEDKKRSRPIGTQSDQHENLENNFKKNKGEETCRYCSKNYHEPYLEKLGACYQYGKWGHLAWKCPSKKTNDSKVGGLVA